MARQRDLLLNFERVRREMDELFGDAWGETGRWRGRAQAGFQPRVDVYYCDADEPKAIVKVELAGIDMEGLNLEISGRELVISGVRPVAETEGRVYQQIEIDGGPFRRAVRLNADVVAEAARATYNDGVLRVELPLKRAGEGSRKVPIEPSGGPDG
jgi:HSP20 family protein